MLPLVSGLLRSLLVNCNHVTIDVYTNTSLTTSVVYPVFVHKMNIPAILILLVVVLVTILKQVNCNETCTEQYTIIPGPTPRDGRDGIQGVPGQTGDKGVRGDIGPTGPKGDPGSTIITEEDLNRVSDNVTAEINESIIAELLDTIQTLNQTLTDRLLYLESQIPVTVCNISSANWRRIAYFDTTQGDSCPSSLRTVTNTATNQTACGRTANHGCTSLQFSPDGNYSNVCGRVRGYQDHSPDGFDTGEDSIDSHYIDGISITHGNPRTHLWSYVAGHPEQFGRSAPLCPCARPDPTDLSGVPSFVGGDFYCESGFSGTSPETRIAWEDPLWDGQGCTSSGNQCCSRYGWFHHEIPTTSDNIEVRWCANQDQSDEDVFTDQLEIWVM